MVERCWRDGGEMLERCWRDVGEVLARVMLERCWWGAVSRDPDFVGYVAAAKS